MKWLAVTSGGGGACWRVRGLEAEDSAQAAVHFVHEGRGELAPAGSRSVVSRVTRAVTLTTESWGSALAVAGTKTLPGIAARPVLEVMTAASVVFNLLAL